MSDLVKGEEFLSFQKALIAVAGSFSRFAVVLDTFADLVETRAREDEAELRDPRYDTGS